LNYIKIKHNGGMKKMEDEKVQDSVSEEVIKDTGMEKVDNALNRMLGKDSEATEKIKSLF